MKSQIDSVEYYCGLSSEKRNHVLHFTPGLNVVSGESGAGKTIIINEIIRMCVEDKLSLKQSDNIKHFKNEIAVIFSEESCSLFGRHPKYIKRLFSELNIKSGDLPFIAERFNCYLNRILKVKTLYPYSKFYGINNNGDDEIFDCVIDPSGSWSIKHKLTGDDLRYYFYAAGEVLTMGFALNMAVKDLINPQLPLVMDSYWCNLDESLTQGVWSELVLRPEAGYYIRYTSSVGKTRSNSNACISLRVEYFIGNTSGR